MARLLAGVAWLLARLKYTAGTLYALAALPLMLRRRPLLRGERLLFAGAAVGLLARSAWRMSSDDFTSWDMVLYRLAGLRAIAGENPYALQNFMTPLTSIPLAEVYALMPLPVAHRFWVVASTAMLLALPFVAWLALGHRRTAGGGPRATFPWAAAGCVYLATASVYGIDAGQTQTLNALLMVGALALRDRGRPLVAGLALSLATIKIGMLLPLLTQFLRRGDRRFWVGFGVGVLLLSAIGSPPGTWPGRLRSNLDNLKGVATPGAGNDYGFDNPISDDLISVSRWLYCVGFRDRPLISRAELGILAAISAWLTWATLARRLPSDALYSFACAFGCCFLYHRMYDTVLLAAPLLHCVERARGEEGWRRGSLVAAIVGMLAVINLPRGWFLKDLSNWSVTADLPGRLVQAIVLPYAVWILFGVMAVIALTGRRPGDEPDPVAPGA